MSSSPATDLRVTVIVPVKGLGTAKSRTGLPSAEREGLVLDLMTRTVRAASAATSVARVIVVAGDATVGSAAQSLGAIVLPDPTPAGLNAAVAAGRRYAQVQFTNEDIAVVVGDLADLSPTELDAVIAEFRRVGDALVVADHLGTGTTMLVHDRCSSPPLMFGADSARKHRAAGYRAYADAPPGARRDVDSRADVELLRLVGH